MQHQPKPPPLRHWLRISLRTAMLVLLLAGVAGAIVWHRYVKPFRFQARVVGDLKRAGASVTTEPGGPQWLRTLLGDDDCQDIRRIDLGDCDVTKEQMATIARLPRLQTLIVAGKAVGDEQLLGLQSVASLEGVIFDSTSASETAVARLKAARPSLLVWESYRRAAARAEESGWRLDFDQLKPPPRFKQLFPHGASYLRRPGYAYFTADLDAAPDAEFIADLRPLTGLVMQGCFGADAVLRCASGLSGLSSVTCRSTDVTGEGLACLSTHGNLTGLDLTGTKVGDAELRHLPDRLESLQLCSSQITDAGMVELARLARLRELNLLSTAVTDAGLKHLHNLTNLEHLFVIEGTITRGGIRRLGKVLPRMEVFMFDKSGYPAIETLGDDPAEPDSRPPVPVPPVELEKFEERR